jgi:methylenetetrahydrofolate reductase (NADPH)
LQGAGLPITAELSMPERLTADGLLKQADRLAGSVDAIQVTESHGSPAQAAPLALASLLMRNGIDAVPRISCRDRNRIALLSDLLGFRALGLSSLVLVKGSPLPGEKPSAAKSVFDVNGTELIAMAQDITEEAWRGSAHEFVIGTGATVFSPEPGWTADYLKSRANAGARFLQTQPCFNMELMSRYMDALVKARLTWKFSVIVTLAPLPSAAMARWLMQNGRSVLMPETILARLDSAGNPENEGIEICAGLMRDYARLPGVSGFNLLALGRPRAVVDAIRASGLRKPH